MVAINTGMRTIFDSAYTERLNISEFIDDISPKDLPMMAILGWGTEAGSVSAGQDSLSFPCTNTLYTWQNDELIPSTGTIATVTSQTELIVTALEGVYLKVDDIIMINDVHYEITNIATDTLTIDGLSGASETGVSVGDRWYKMGQLRFDGEAFSTTYKSTDVASTSNHTQIWHEVISVSGTSMATEKFGIENEFDREFSKKFQELVIEMERAILYGRRTSSFPTVNNDENLVRRMGGLYEYIRQGSGTNVTNGGGNLLTEKTLVDLLQTIWDDGGMPDTIMTGFTQKRVLNSFIVPAVRTERTEDTGGVMMGTYESDAGSLDIVVNRHMKPTDLIVFTRTDIGFGALKGNGVDRSLFMTDVPVDGDRSIKAITGEYTLEVRNATRAHGWLHNLSTTLV